MVATQETVTREQKAEPLLVCISRFCLAEMFHEGYWTFGSPLHTVASSLLEPLIELNLDSSFLAIHAQHHSISSKLELVLLKHTVSR